MCVILRSGLLKCWTNIQSSSFYFIIRNRYNFDDEMFLKILQAGDSWKCPNKIKMIGPFYLISFFSSKYFKICQFVCRIRVTYSCNFVCRIRPNVIFRMLYSYPMADTLMGVAYYAWCCIRKCAFGVFFWKISWCTWFDASEE